MKNRIVNALPHFYPSAWRREYGPELMDILFSRPLTAGIITNVLANGLR
jgi:hypothetical protein